MTPREFSEARKLLAQLYAPTVAAGWLDEVNPFLGARPADLIRAGQGELVIGHLQALLEGAFQ